MDVLFTFSSSTIRQSILGLAAHFAQVQFSTIITFHWIYPCFWKIVISSVLLFQPCHTFYSHIIRSKSFDISVFPRSYIPYEFHVIPILSILLAFPCTNLFHYFANYTHIVIVISRYLCYPL